MKITILGAGNGGQAMAGHFAMLGHCIALWNRTEERIRPLLSEPLIELSDAITGNGRPGLITTDLPKAVAGADLIMVTTTADGHRELASQLAPWLEDGQTILLNPGRTLGALEFSGILRTLSSRRVYIAEAQSLIYACRAEQPGKVRIIGVKERVLLAAYPASDTEHVIHLANTVFNCFIEAPNILVTSLENIGAIFHPAIVLFNAATIERGEVFYFYNDMTPAIAGFLEALDRERIETGKAFGITLHTVSEWISFAYKDIQGTDLCTKMKNNPAYYQILSPDRLRSRMLLEDIPTGIVPMAQLARMAGVRVPLMESIIHLSSALLNTDFQSAGRTFKQLGLEGITPVELLRKVNQ